MISHVLDTCAVLDLAAGRWTDKTARRELASALDPVILTVSVWEIARKLRLGKLRLPCEVDGVLSFMEELCERHQLRIVPLSAETCQEAECLPANHEDPFDRMIIAFAAQGSCPIFTTDKRFSAYSVVVMPQR
jgi:PIN domain nuclease of toxin-antitoxin system